MYKLKFYFLVLISLIFGAIIGSYISDIFFAKILGGITGFVIFNTINSIKKFNNEKTHLRGVSILLILLALAWFFILF